MKNQDPDAEYVQKLFFICGNCNHEFKPDLAKDEDSHRVKLVIIKFYPPHSRGKYADWSPIAETKTAFATCPKCGKETHYLKDVPKKNPKAT